jgi:hypothetical protein
LGVYCGCIQIFMPHGRLNSDYVHAGFLYHPSAECVPECVRREGKAAKVGVFAYYPPDS